MSRPNTNAPSLAGHGAQAERISFHLQADGSRHCYVCSSRSQWRIEAGGNKASPNNALPGEGAGRGQPGDLSGNSFAEVAEQWLESKRHLRPWTRKSYRAALDLVLIPRFGKLRLSAISADDVARLIRELEKRGPSGKPLSSSMIDLYLRPLASTMAFGLRRGLIGTNPCSLLTRDDRPQRRERRQDHVWSNEEMNTLIQAAEQLGRKPTSRYDYTPLIRTALFTGLRLGELLGLQWQDVDVRGGVVHVRRQWTRLGNYAPPKTEAGIRRLPLSEEMTKYLAALKLCSRYSNDDDPVFASRNGKPLTHRNATRRGFEAAAAEAGIKGVSFHSMRHAFASRMINRGISSTVLAALMGHQSSTITERRYVHLFDQRRTDEQVRQAMASSFGGVTSAP